MNCKLQDVLQTRAVGHLGLIRVYTREGRWGTNLVGDGHKFDKISINSDCLFRRNSKLFVFSTNYL